MEPKQGGPQLHLVKSAKVEVSSNEDGYKGAWYPATILEPCPSTRSSPATAKKGRSFTETPGFLVQYDTLLRNDVTMEPLTEPVKVGFIRPPPPPDDAIKSFEVGDPVDGFSLDGWWPGVVVNVEGDRYAVGFRDPPDLLVLGRPNLRPHWDFKDGIWARARSHKPERVNGYEFSHGTAIEMNPKKGAWFPATYLGQLGINSHLLQYKSSEGRDSKVVVKSQRFRPQPPNLPESRFSLSGIVDTIQEKGWDVGVITKELAENHYMVRVMSTGQEKECSHTQMRPSLKWKGGRWFIKENRRYVLISEEVQIGKDHDQFGTDYELRSKHGCNRVINSEVATLPESTEDSTEEQTVCSRISLKNHASPSGKTSKRLKMSQKATDNASNVGVFKKVDWENSKVPFSAVYARRTPVETSNQNASVREAENNEQLQPNKRKRESVGVNKGSETTKAGQEDVEDGLVMDNSGFSGMRSESEITGALLVGTSGLIPMEEVEQQNEDEPSSEIKLPQKDPETACGREDDNGAGCVSVDCMNTVFELPAITTKLDLIGKECNDIAAEVELTKTKDVEDKGLADALVVAETVDSAIDNMTKEDQGALPFFIDETHSPKNIEGSSNLVSTANQQNEANSIQVQIGVTGNPARTANQQNEIRGTQVETGVTGNVQQQDSPGLPFVKKHLNVWETIESMEAFKRYPQYPHFHPLVNCEDLKRESMAMQKMMSFAALIHEIPNLQVENYRDFFPSSLQTLDELETFGFDVKEVRCFLNSLLEMSVKFEELQDQSKELELKVVKRTHDTTNNKEKICVVDKEIKDLQEKLKVLEERREVLMSLNEAKGLEISRLELESSDITKSIQSIMRVFKERVSAF